MLGSRARRGGRPPAPEPNESFWIEAIDTSGREPPLEGMEEADVALVGGGYTSLVTAYCLKRLRPELELALLESSYVGFGSSGRNAGMVLHEPHTERLRARGERAVRFTYDQTVGAVDVIDQIAREAGFDCELERTGYFAVGLYPAHLTIIREDRERSRALGIDLPRLGEEEIQAQIHSRRFRGALFFPRAALLHPGKYVSGLKRAVRALGVRIYERSPLIGMREGRSVEIETAEGKLRAPAVVVGLNAYLSSTGMRILRDRAVSLQSFIILTAPLSADRWKEIGWTGRQGYSDLRRIHNYVRPVGDRILFGGRVLYHFDLEAPARRDWIYESLYREMVLTFPCLEGVEITHRWCGSVAMTWRRAPVIGRTGRFDNVYYALGYSGMGVSLATLSGRVLADLLLGERDRWRDLLYLVDPARPLPPEPFRYLGFQGSYYAMRLADAFDRWRDKPGARKSARTLRERSEPGPHGPRKGRAR